MDTDPKILSWLAGLFEGEASFGYGVPSEPHSPRISINMTDEDVIAKVAALFGHGYTPIAPQKEHWNIKYRFTLKGIRAARLMQQIFPIMGQRRQGQIDRALENYVYNPNANTTQAKITEEQVRAIKKRLVTGETAKSIAQDFPISHYAIWDIRSGKTWGHLSISDHSPTETTASEETVPLQHSEENDFYWMVGLLEGEGSFMSGPPSAPNNPRISIAMTDQDIIERVVQLCQTTSQTLRSRNEHHKRVYRMLLRGKTAVDLMKRLHPLMGIRRQAQINRVLENYVDIPINKGMYNPSAKISEGQAKAIKQRLQDGENLTTIAADYNISVSIVREIKLGCTWKHITI
jgi:hypothetical protein